MKVFIMSITLFFVMTWALVFQLQYDNHEHELFNLKFVARESAMSAAQYFNYQDYSKGQMIFNQTEGKKAIEDTLINLLNLNSDLTPKANTYWTDPITYTVKYFDDSNSTYPFIYTPPGAQRNILIKGPTVVVTVQTGSARYKFFTSKNNYQIGSYELQPR